MTIGEMHYDFKYKFNKIDSQKSRNFNVPEIDWQLNEAIEIFVKVIAQPMLAGKFGFEISQRTIDDIRTIVVDQKPEEGIIPTKYDDTSFIIGLPSNYWFYANSNIYLKKDKCEKKARKVILVQHDDNSETSVFNKSNFLWSEVNIRFNKNGIRIFTDGSFDITKVCLEYLEQPKRVHNAVAWRGGSYKLLDGTVLSGTQDCNLPPKVHGEIVDLAVLIASGNLGQQDYAFKKSKLELVQD